MYTYNLIQNEERDFKQTEHHFIDRHNAFSRQARQRFSAPAQWSWSLQPILAPRPTEALNTCAQAFTRSRLGIRYDDALGLAFAVHVVARSFTGSRCLHVGTLGWQVWWVQLQYRRLFISFLIQLQLHEACVNVWCVY